MPTLCWPSVSTFLPPPACRIRFALYTISTRQFPDTNTPSVFMTPAPLVAMALAMATWFLPIPTPAWAGTPPSQQHGAARPIDDLLRQITEGSFDFVDETGKSLLARRRGDGPVKQLTERAVFYWATTSLAHQSIM